MFGGVFDSASIDKSISDKEKLTEAPGFWDNHEEAGKGNKINIFWTLPENPEKEISSFFIYRDTRQIASYAQIKNISPIAQIDSNFSGYTDLVKDYNDYFYCVLAVTKDSSVPYDLILLSFNSTVKGVPNNTFNSIEELFKYINS